MQCSFALHALTGCNTTSKFGTKTAGLNVNPSKYLMEFAKSSFHLKYRSLICASGRVLNSGVEKQLKNRSSAKSMDEL